MPPMNWLGVTTPLHQPDPLIPHLREGFLDCILFLARVPGAEGFPCRRQGSGICQSHELVLFRLHCCSPLGSWSSRLGQPPQWCHCVGVSHETLIERIMIDASRTRGASCAFRSQSHETWQTAPIYIGNTKSGIALPMTPTVTERALRRRGNKPRIGNGSLMIAVEGIQQLVVGSSISPIRLEKRLPLPSMPAH